MNETAQQAQAPHLVVDNKQLAPGRLKVTAVGHSPLFYWWPVWVLSFAFGLLTYFQVPNTYIQSSLRTADAERATWIVLSTSELGIVFCMVCGLIVLIANVSLRGWASFGVVGGILFATLLFAYLGWWDTILGFLDNQRFYMNSGFYFFLGTVLLVPWLLVFFVFDRLSYWVFVPGQAIHKKLVGLVWAKSTTLTITTRRTVLKHGLLKKEIVDVSHADIDYLHVHRGRINRLLHTGDLAVIAKGSKKTLLLMAAPNPEETASVIRAQVIGVSADALSTDQGPVVNENGEHPNPEQNR